MEKHNNGLYLYTEHQLLYRDSKQTFDISIAIYRNNHKYISNF